ncbi:MAG TPA: histidine--tRNA ligase [Actinomycetes bacterium]|nr:histidine--tRNA ligase [Actinomycetes bacterium]
MARPRPLSGFPEWLPAERIAEQRVLDQLRRTFELWGFVSVETRAVEPLEQMLRKGEIDKEVYVLRRLHADPDSSDSELGLHYDLTVPFARYVLENAGHLQFPFKRYQIQRCWRGERPQEGRYREFTQADVDIVGDGTLAFHHDVEVAAVMADALGALGLPHLTLQLNNRKLIEGFYRGLGATDVGAVMRAVDKLDKARPAEVRALLTAAGLNDAQADACLALASVSATDASFVDDVRALGVRDDLLDTGLEELALVLDGAASIAGERVTVTADLRIARGLDYYTGTVFETRMTGFEHVGSICSGGRYDALASDGDRVFPGVGISFGVTRALGPLFARGLMGANRTSPACVLVAVAAEGTRGASAAVARVLRSRGIPCDVAPAADKYGRQIRHADRRGIPYVWFPSGSGDEVDEVKDIRSGDQVPADAATWTPPVEDLHPSITLPPI